MSSDYGQFGLSVLKVIGNLSFFFGVHIFENCDLLWSIIRKKEEEITHGVCVCVGGGGRENIHLFIY